MNNYLPQMVNKVRNIYSICAEKLDSKELDILIYHLKQLKKFKSINEKKEKKGK